MNGMDRVMAELLLRGHDDRTMSVVEVFHRVLSAVGLLYEVDSIAILLLKDSPSEPGKVAPLYMSATGDHAERSQSREVMRQVAEKIGEVLRENPNVRIDEALGDEVEE